MKFLQSSEIDFTLEFLLLKKSNALVILLMIFMILHFKKFIKKSPFGRFTKRTYSLNYKKRLNLSLLGITGALHTNTRLPTHHLVLGNRFHVFIIIHFYCL